MPLTQDCPAPLIGSLTGHYSNTGRHSSSLWSASLTSVLQESFGICLHSAQWYNCAVSLGNILEASEVGTSLYSGDFRWHQWCLHYRGSTVLILVHTVATHKSTTLLQRVIL